MDLPAVIQRRAGGEILVNSITPDRLCLGFELDRAAVETATGPSWKLGQQGIAEDSA